MLRPIISCALLFPMFGAAGCGENEDRDARTTVVATTTQVADLARAVAGDRAGVSGLLAAGADPHDYEPRPSDARRLGDADLLVRSGGDLDEWVEELAESSGSGATRLSLLDGTRTIEGNGGEPDPHWWQDPRNAMRAVRAIRDRLAEIDPPGAAAYERSAAAYIARLERLDAAIAGCLARLPRERRQLVTSHGALRYFAARYGLGIVGSTIPALTTQAQPSAGETAELVDLIRERDVRALFPESGVSTKVERAVSRETGAVLGEELYADSLGPGGSPGATYLGATAENARRIAAGLSGGELRCELPA